ncbi:MAG: TauD/TfdA dioxygenase family protein [Gammaproteobacteria bacterium]
MEFRALHRRFGAEVVGVDLGNVGDAEFEQVRAGFERYSVLLFRDQDITVEHQVDFSARFGPLEDALSHLGDSGAGRKIANIANVDERGSVRDPQERAMLSRKANGLWHTDSSFKAVPALASLLRAVRIPPQGGETEFVSTRAAYADLPGDMRDRAQTLVAVHSYAHSRAQIAPNLLGPELEAKLPPVRRPLVYTHPRSGARSLYLASHIREVEGMALEEGRALVAELVAFSTAPERIYRHQWRLGDLVMWDNRATMHRGRTWDAQRYPRVMHRTTISDTSAALAA